MATQVTLNSGSVDSAGSLLLRTNGTTTAVTLDTSQNATFAGKVTSAGSLLLASNGTTTAVTIDTSGNLGLGVTPSAWDSTTIRPLEINRAGNFVGGNGSSSAVYLGANARFSGASWRYANTGAAAVYTVEDNTHFWRIAPSGTAGNAITFTQAMTLDASGNLLIGATSGSATIGAARGAGVSALLELAGNGNTIASTSLALGQGTDSSAYVYQRANAALIFGTNNTERARIDSSGNLLVGTTTAEATGLTVNKAAGSNSVAYLYNTSNSSGDAAAYFALGANANNTSSFMLVCTQPGTRNVMYIYGNGNIVNQNNSYGVMSDVKLKENIVDATPKLADVMRLQVRNYNLKTDPTQKQIGFVAQELEQVFPGMVDESPDLDENGNALDTFTKSIKTSVLVPILVKAIQEQQVLITSLTERISALEAK